MPVTASIKLLPEYHTYGREQKKSATIMIADWVQEQAPAGGDGEIWTLATVLPYYRISSADPSATWVHLLVSTILLYK